MHILITDELLDGTVTNQFEIDVDGNTLSAEGLIQKRVTLEVENYNKKLPEYYHGLVKPNEAESTLNGFKLRTRQHIDVEKQVYVALDAFQKNGFFILVDNMQIEALNEPIHLKKDSKISFVKLTPLIGG